MHHRFRPLIGLAVLALFLVGPAPALARGKPLQQTVDGYTLTLVPPAQGLVTGQNTIAVTLQDAQGNTPAATLSAALLAFSPAAEGHGGTGAAADDHGANDAHATVDDHAAADDHVAADGTHEGSGHEAMPGMADMPDMPEMSAADGHEDAAAASAEAEHNHDAAGALEGQGIAAAPVALAAASDGDIYQGTLSFDKPGTWTISVVFVIDGQEHGAIFVLPIAQSRPRWLVLGGFALVNALVVGSAAVIKRRTPAKASRSTPRPTLTPTTPNRTTVISPASSPEEQPR
jgi:hypothetical protein